MTSERKETTYYRKGLGRKQKVAPLLYQDYHSGLVEYFRKNGYQLVQGDLEIRLAKEFGFCYGVDRAVEYAYECRDRFPDRRLWITGEIIHNPWVNQRLEEMGIRFLDPPGKSADRLGPVRSGDVVLIPAFGMEHRDFIKLRERGVVLVDTTCGSVLSVWKSVERYARDGFTAIVHGKMNHEETRATCSQVLKYDGAHYLVLRDKEETGWVCEYIRGALDPRELLERLDGAYSEQFDPNLQLGRIGLANQTTMLSTESLEIAGLLRDAMQQRYGEAELEGRFLSFDTICSATQDRQDAIKELLLEPCDLMLVIGGFNSSNTSHLLEICLSTTLAYHIEDASCLISPASIRHKTLVRSEPIVEEDWLPEQPLKIGMSAGASTPDSAVGAVIARLLSFHGISEDRVRELADVGSRLAEAEKGRGGKSSTGTPLPVEDPRPGS